MANPPTIDERYSFFRIVSFVVNTHTRICPMVSYAYLFKEKKLAQKYGAIRSEKKEKNYLCRHQEQAE